jgi:hypothetical protein
MAALKTVSVLTKMANDAAASPINLLAANKETVKELNLPKPEDEPPRRCARRSAGTNGSRPTGLRTDVDSQAGGQLPAIEADWCDELFYGGERYGGKSDYQLGYQEDGALRYGRHYRGIMFRKTYPELEELQARAMEVFPQEGAIYKSQPSAEYPFSNCWYWPSGASVKMRFIENEKDYGRYHGHQYCRISFDEVTEYPTNSGFLKMLSCLRSPNGIPCTVRLTGNPGGIGHVWVKARYVDVAPPLTPYLDPETGFVRMFVPSKMAHNRIGMTADPGYANRLLAATAGNDALRKAWFEGDWDIVAGAFFDNWRRTSTWCRRFTPPKHWTRAGRWTGAATGRSQRRLVVHRRGRVGEVGGRLRSACFPAGALIRYREWYGAASASGGNDAQHRAEAGRRGGRRAASRSAKPARRSTRT